MGGGIRISRIFGIPIYLHPTWFIVFALVTLFLWTDLGLTARAWNASTRLLLAVSTSVLFFASILLHELGHSLLALRHRVGVRSITLFIFGGVALMDREPESPRAEFQIAIAGPLVSALLALAFGALAAAVETQSSIHSLVGWLSDINLAVAVFNLLPGFPLDGGRVLRAALWARNGDAARSTRTAATAGQYIAYGFMGIGALQFLAFQQTAAGIWLGFIGWFLYSASAAAIRQAKVDQSLHGLCARDVMALSVARIEAGASVEDFTRDRVMRGQRWAIVEHGDRPLGLVTLTDVRKVSASLAATTRIESIATPMDQVLTASPDAPVRDLVVEMGRQQTNQIPILEGGRIVGAVTRETLLSAIELGSRDAG